MQLLGTAVTIYTLYCFAAWTMILLAQRRDRFPSIVIAGLFPVVIVLGLIHSLFTLNHSNLHPCPEGLEEAEAVVEQRRQRMFQSKPIQPSIARSWKKRYAMSLELQAKQLRKLSIQVRQILAIA